MGEFVIILIKYVGVSGILMSLYMLLFKGKSSFISQRIYLLAIPIISLIAATLSLQIIEVQIDDSLGQMITSAENISQSITSNEAYVVINQEIKAFEHKKTINLEFSTIILILSSIVSIVLLTRYIYGARQISSINKLSSHTKLGSVSIYRCGLIETPFSFFRSIYIDRDTEGRKLDMVLSHEFAHINNRHYVDKLISEFYVIISWFNPFVWNIRREIALVHEFQADSSVIRSNFNVKEYKRYLFDEIVFHSPAMSSGFNNSLIKQRFIQMRNNYQIKNSKLRKVFTLPVIICTLTLTSLTYLNEEAIASETNKKIEAINNIISLNDTEEVKIDNNEKSIVAQVDSSAIKDQLKRNEQMEAISEHLSPIKEEIVTPQVSIDTLKKSAILQKANDTKATTTPPKSAAEAKADSIEKVRERYNYYYLSDNQIDITYQNTPRVAVYRYDDHTEVDFCFNVPYDWYWVNFSKNTFLVDEKRGDKYKLHSAKNDIPIDRNLVFRDVKGKKCVITLIFPPLKNNVRHVDIMEEHSSTLLTPPNGSGSRSYRRVKVEKQRSYQSSNIITLDSNFEYNK